MDQLGGAEPVDVESGIRDTLRVLASKVRDKSATIEIDVQPDLPCVMGKGAELNQVWMNLLDNALDAIDESGHIWIKTDVETDSVLIRIIDDGQGIPPTAIRQVFDAFFTTKPPGQGTGLGLEIARRIVRRHQGDITVDSRDGRTEFCVRLVTSETGLAADGLPQPISFTEG
jgi:signal transduction histidine kinase